MSREPNVPVGLTQVIDGEDATTTLDADAPPIVTVAPVTNCVPVIVTEVEPESGPRAGLTDATVGADRLVRNPKAENI